MAGEKLVSKALRAAKLPSRVVDYTDPPSKKIEDWKWRPLADVARELDVKKIPPHVKEFGDYMIEMAEKAKRGEISDRDLIKAYTTTRASIQRRSQDTDKIREASGLPLVGAEEKIRPEGAWSEWLMSPAGQRYLDKAVKGEMPADTVESALSLMRSFGLAPTQINAMDWAAKNLPGRGQAASDLVYRASQKASPVSEWRDFTSDVAGVGSSKSGFLASLLGRGDLPTLDARQVILNTGLPTEASQKVMARSYEGQKGFGAQEGVDRLAARQEALDLKAPQKYDPFYQHLTHHTIWDKASGEKTTHADIMNAMRNAAIVLGTPAAGAAFVSEEKPNEPQGFADGGSVDQALNLLRQNFDEGGFVNSLRGMFSGPEYQSTGDKVVGDGEINWGNPESAADFFRADKARMAMDKLPETTAPFPPRRPVEAPAPVRPVTTPPSVKPEPSILDMAFGQPVYGDKTQRFGDRSDSPAAGVDYTLGSGGDRAIFRPLSRVEPEAGAVPFAPNTGTARSSALQAIENATRPPNPNDVVNLSNNPNALPYAPSTAATPLDIRDISHLSRYRGSAMDNPEAVIFHHTAGRGTPEGVIDTLNTRRDPFTGRPMTLGAHYIIDRDGSIHAALPSGIRGAHIRPSKINDLSNYNTYGVEVIARDNSDITPAQIAAGQRLYSHLSAGRSNPLGIYGHGELNPGHKLPDEGLAIVNAIREAAAMREGRAGGGKAVSKALKAVSELFDSPGMAQWREGSKIPASSVEDRYFTGTSKDKDFANFNVGRHGAWFTKDPADASMYARENDSKGYRREGWDMVPVNTADRVIPAFLRSENPFTGPLPDMARAENYKKAQSDWFDQLRSQGHDAWMPETDPNLAVILRDPSNIKSAISNTGEFDRTSPRVDRAEGGEVGGDDYQSPRSRVRAALDLVQSQMAPQVADGEGFQRALQNYRNFPQQQGEATARPLNLDARDVIGGAIAGDPQRGDSAYLNKMRRRSADAIFGSTGMPGSGTLGFGIADAPMLTGLPLMASDIAGSAGRGDYAEAALGAALPAAFYARKPIGKALGVARDALGRVPAPVAAGAAGAAVMSPEDAEAGKADMVRKALNAVRLSEPAPRKMTLQEVRRTFDPRAGEGMQGEELDRLVDAYGRVASPASLDPDLARRGQEIAQTYITKGGSGYGGRSYFAQKPSVPLEDLGRAAEPIPYTYEPKTIVDKSWETVGRERAGSPVISLGGDLSDLVRLRGYGPANDLRALANPTDIHAGFDYMREPNLGSVWSNNPEHAAMLEKAVLGQKDIQRAVKKDLPVMAVANPMGPGAIDSAKNMMDLYLSALEGSAVPPDYLSLANKIIRSGSLGDSPKAKEKLKEKLAGFPGFENMGKAREFLLNNPDVAGTTRAAIIKGMERSDWVKKGFPEVGQLRVAASSPKFMMAPGNMMGGRMVELDPRMFHQAELNRYFKHFTYGGDSPGTYYADVPLIHRQYGAPDATDMLMAKYNQWRPGATKKAPPKAPITVHPFSTDQSGRDTWRKMFEEQRMVQSINDRMMESIRRGEQRRDMYGFKKGGSVSHRALMLASSNT